MDPRLSTMRLRPPNQVGRSVVVAKGTSQEVCRFEWPTDPGTGVRGSGLVAVTLFQKYGDPPFSNPLFAARGVAHIFFGAQGAMARVDVDIGRGSVINVPCSMLTVTVENESTNPSSSDMELGAFAVPGGATPARGPTRTIYHGTLAFGAFQAYTVPYFARTVRIERETAAVPLRIWLRDHGVSPAEKYQVIVPANTECPEIPLSGDITAVEVENTDGAVSATAVRWIFGLGL